MLTLLSDKGQGVIGGLSLIGSSAPLTNNVNPYQGQSSNLEQ